MRKLLLGAASVVALGIGSAALDFAADADDTIPSAGWSAPSAAGTSQHLINAENLSKDDIRWAQLKLRNMGLYGGSLDGVVGPETKRALAEFQESNGLEETAALDQETADALIGNSGIGQGSSVQPRSGAGSATNLGTSGQK